MTTSKHLRGIVNESVFAKNIDKYFCGINKKDFTYIGYDDEKSRELATILMEDSGIKLVFDSKEQCSGCDFKFRNEITIDLKVNSKKYSNPYYELFYDGKRYSYNMDNSETHIIASVIKYCNKIILAPAIVIEEIANRKYEGDKRFSDLYNNKKLLRIVENDKEGKRGVIINSDVVIEYTKEYLSKRCDNSNMSSLLVGSRIITDYTDKYF